VIGRNRDELSSNVETGMDTVSSTVWRGHIFKTPILETIWAIGTNVFASSCDEGKKRNRDRILSAVHKYRDFVFNFLKEIRS